MISAKPLPLFVEGYTSQLSYAPGDEVALCVSTTAAKYNIEISRYTLYSGEPIFTGKFRIPPGPLLWVVLYLLLDLGAVFPYLAMGAASPLIALDSPSARGSTLTWSSPMRAGNSLQGIKE